MQDLLVPESPKKEIKELGAPSPTCILLTNRQIAIFLDLSEKKLSHYVRRIFYFKITLILQKGNGKFVRERERDRWAKDSQ